MKTFAQIAKRKKAASGIRQMTDTQRPNSSGNLDAGKIDEARKVAKKADRNADKTRGVKGMAVSAPSGVLSNDQTGTVMANDRVEQG